MNSNNFITSLLRLRREIKIYVTSKLGKAQRVARPACANATVHFLLPYRLAVLMPPSEWPLKTSALRILVYVHSPPVQMSHTISGVTGSKFTKFVAAVIFFSSQQSALQSIYTRCRMTGVTLTKKKVTSVKHKPASGIAMPGGLTRKCELAPDRMVCRKEILTRRMSIWRSCRG